MNMTITEGGFWQESSDPPERDGLPVKGRRNPSPGPTQAPGGSLGKPVNPASKLRLQAAQSPRLKPLRKILPLLVPFLLVAAAVWGADDAASRLILLVNSNLPESRRIAEHYAAARHVPAANIIALPMSSEETINWSEFLATIWQPLQAELVRQKWIDGLPMALTDKVGRKEYVIGGHRISYLVTCRGVPLRIAHTAELFVPRPAPYHPAELATNQGAVDSELSLLAQPDYPINAFVPNPLFRVDRPSFWDLEKVVKVTRLDGPTVEDALGLVDRAEYHGHACERSDVHELHPHASGPGAHARMA
jgi:hypothetical protein